MHKLEITLKQHTPLIHFQHDQDGATLRASEVKPKLDKFLLKQTFNNNFDLCKEYLNGYCEKNERNIREKFNNGIRALDYKIKIIVTDKPKNIKLKIVPKENRESKIVKHHTEVNNEDFPFLMSNMGGKESPEELINLVLYDSILLEFRTKHKYIREILLKYTIVFFSRHNFGQRKTKGFGSFTVKEIEGQTIPWNESVIPQGSLYMKFSTENKNGILNKQYAIFKTLDFYWKCLKSGVNYTRNEESDEMKLRYIKAYYWHYLNNAGNTWEKKSIKTHFKLITGKDETKDNKNKVSFARALLGSPDKFEYKDRLRRFKNETVKIEHDESNKDLLIARIPSPVIFKPIIKGDEVTVYILFDPEIRRKIRQTSNLKFKFSVKKHTPIFLNLDPEVIDNYKDLIESYHQYFTEDPDVKESVFYMIDREDIENSMVPRDFGWNNILGEEEIVKFGKTEKK